MIFIKILKNKILIGKQKMLIVFDYMIADILTNEKLNPIVTESFIRGRKVGICLTLITQLHFSVPKNIKLNLKYYFFNENSKQNITSTNCI